VAGKFIDTVIHAGHRRDPNDLIGKRHWVIHGKLIIQNTRRGRREAFDEKTILRRAIGDAAETEAANLVAEVSSLNDQGGVSRQTTAL